jgi:Tol biopolymer transport system component
MVFRPVPDRPVGQSVIPEPLTTYPGFEETPAFSPDGTRIAFVWDGPLQNNWDVYIKLVGDGEPLRITSNTADDLSPVWSPDGLSIAFLRRGKGKASVVVVPALGGPEKIIAAIVDPIGDPSSAHSRILAWTPDGNWLVVPARDPQSGVTGLSLLSVRTGEIRQLTTTPTGTKPVSDSTPALSPDGRYLAFSRRLGPDNADLFVLRLGSGYWPAGGPQRWTKTDAVNDEPAWTPDARQIVFHRHRAVESGLWVVDADGAHRARPLSGVGTSAASPAVSPQGRLAYVNHGVQDTNIWRLTLTERNASPRSVIVSSLADTNPQYSPDGRSVAFESNRQGKPEIWIAGEDGSGAFALTHFDRGHTGTPRWRPDGRQIAFDSNVSGDFQVYLADVDGGEPKLLTKFGAPAFIPSWSRDGRWVYFTGRQTGQEEVWKIPAEGGKAARITTNGGNTPFESGDGTLVFYLRGGSLWSIPISGGKEVMVIDNVYNRNYAVGRHGIYFERRLATNGSAICYRPFDAHREQLLYQTLKVTHLGLAVSPDEKFLLFAQVDGEGSDLMIADYPR